MVFVSDVLCLTVLHSTKITAQTDCCVGECSLITATFSTCCSQLSIHVARKTSSFNRHCMTTMKNPPCFNAGSVPKYCKRNTGNARHVLEDVRYFCSFLRFHTRNFHLAYKLPVIPQYLLLHSIYYNTKRKHPLFQHVHFSSYCPLCFVSTVSGGMILALTL